jgi:hypothetical protein
MQQLPLIDMRHVLVLTDGTAMMQHATHATPNPHHGYCTDDNARALIAAVLYFDHRDEPPVSDLNGGAAPDSVMVATQRYLAFLAYAYHPNTGRFRNFMDYDRSWLEEVGSEDSHARAVWGLGVAARRGPIPDIRDHAASIFDGAITVLDEMRYLRPLTFSLLGIHEYCQARENDQAAAQRKVLAERLWEIYQANADDDWPWWENELTWGNAKLPHALMVAGADLDKPEWIQAACHSLQWLLDVQTGNTGHLSIVGNRGWYVRGGERARFDQQPIEAQGLVQACLAAARITGESAWVDHAVRCFEWFTGRNDVGVSMYNADTGGGQDGLHVDGADPNQGAESTLAYVLSALELLDYARDAGRPDIARAAD